MGGKSILAILVPAFAALLWALVKDTYVAVAIEEATQRAAEYLGVPRAAMIAAATPYILSLGVCTALAVTSYKFGNRDRALKPAFEFIYDENDSQWVKTDHPQRISYLFGLHILAPQTVDFPNVWILASPFTQRKFDPETPSGAYQIYKGGAMDTDVTEAIELFDLPPDRAYLDLRNDDDPLGSVQRFTLEARGRHCKPVRANFEYNPNKIPMIRMIP